MSAAAIGLHDDSISSVVSADADVVNMLRQRNASTYSTQRVF